MAIRRNADFGGASTVGLAALVLSVKPGLTRQQVKEVLRDTADRIGPDHDPVTGRSPKFGFGRVNAREAVLKAKSM